MTDPTWPESLGPQTPALLTDWYQLAMVQAYQDAGLTQDAVFELLVRKLPSTRRFLMCAGVAAVLHELEHMQLSDHEMAWLRSTGRLKDAGLQALSDMRFTGDVVAMPEGTVCFADEPILRITAPIAQAQWVESRVLNLMHHATLVASKAARCVLAAAGKTLIDFGMRRAHGAEAAMTTAYAAWLAGFDGTATALASARWAIPVFGTMAHSFVAAFEDEADAFCQFAQSHGGGLTLLLDTYDTERAARRVVSLAPRLQALGATLYAVRLDSGDLAQHAQKVRHILDAGGLSKVQIFVSGGLDERQVAGLVAHAPIDGFGIGTALATSADAPALDAVYKLVAYAGMPRRKRSEGKLGWPGCKQVYRLLRADGGWSHDIICRAEEPAPVGGRPLLQPVMRGGKRVADLPSLAESRAYARAQLAALPEALRELAPAPGVALYPVQISAELRRLAQWVDKQAH